MDFMKEMYEANYKEITKKEKERLKEKIDEANRCCAVISDTCCAVNGDMAQTFAMLTSFMRMIVEDFEKEMSKEDIKKEFENSIKLAFMSERELMMETLKKMMESMFGDEDGK
jgi:hypothetical protein